MTEELWQAFVQFTGAVNALLLGGALLLSPGLRRLRSGRKLGLAFVAYCYLLLSFTAVDNGWVQATWEFLLADAVVALLASALFLHYMYGALGDDRPLLLIYLPPIIFPAVAVVLGVKFIVGSSIYVVVVLQFMYSIVTTWKYFVSRNDLANRPRHLIVLLIGLWTLHFFQLLHMSYPDVSSLFDAVPLVGAALIILLTALILTDSRALRYFGVVIQQQGSSAIDVAAIETYMDQERPYLDPKITLGQLAAALGVSRPGPFSECQRTAKRKFLPIPQ